MFDQDASDVVVSQPSIDKRWNSGIGGTNGELFFVRAMGTELPLVSSSVAVLPVLANMSSSNLPFTEPTMNFLKHPLDMTIMDGNDSHGLWEEKNIGGLAQSGMQKSSDRVTFLRPTSLFLGRILLFNVLF